jgi:integrase
VAELLDRWLEWRQSVRPISPTTVATYRGYIDRLAVVLGARRGELCAVRWSDVDLDQGEVLIAGGIVRVPGESLVDKATKTHAKRRVAVGADTGELLRAHRLAQAKDALACGTTLAADAYVFSHAPNGSAPINPDGITHRFRRLARRLGVRCRLHDLRHFMVTQLVAGGVDWRTVAGRARAELLSDELVALTTLPSGLVVARSGEGLPASGKVLLSSGGDGLIAWLREREPELK